MCMGMPPTGVWTNELEIDCSGLSRVNSKRRWYTSVVVQQAFTSEEDSHDDVGHV